MNKAIPEKFNVGWHYQEYLKRVGVTEAMLHPVQRIEMKRAFYGAWGQALVVLRDDLPEDENESVGILQNMYEQVLAFFQKKARRQN